ncbi:MAG TPA: CoA transferase [Acidimicrobiales bacterium]|nr:CoA transferase [Acidimicrobiales bacterium]
MPEIPWRGVTSGDTGTGLVGDPTRQEPPPGGALRGLRALILSPSLVGALVAQFLADNGAEVVIVEPVAGSPLRAAAAWPAWSRGSKSIELDLHEASARAVAASLAGDADVVFEAFRPGVVERWGLGYEQLAAVAPGLVYASVTGFGRHGPLARLKAYEGIVMAKIGAYDQFGVLVDRPGPAFPSVAYCSFSAAQLALQGILAALFERERSGLGQRVDTTLVQGIAAHDVFNWMVRLVALRYSEAFAEVPPVDPRTQVPNSWMAYALMIGLSADGRWLQFSQATPKLFAAFLRAVELDGPEWDRAWEDEDLGRRSAFRDRALQAIRARTLAQWDDVFDQDPDVFAEVFRSGNELLSHPQLLHDRQVVEVADPRYGTIRQPAPLVGMSRTPGRADRPSPDLDEHGEELRARGWAWGSVRRGVAPTHEALARRPEATTRPDLPLAGVTILELGTFFAGPFGATLLADLGARVLKIEQLDGDPIRWQLPMPEIGAVKVLLGKESVAIDFNTPEGRDLVREIVKGCDLALVTFRAGVAERVGLDEASLRALNPEIIYHSAPGFGTDGPYAHRPAYAPTIGAGSGMARRNVGSGIPEHPGLTLDEVKAGATRLAAANLTVGHADGFSGIAVATGLLLGLVARERGQGGQATRTSMLSTMSHVLSDDAIEYEGRIPVPAPDPQLHGLGALYRLYETADGWVFLAATASDWAALTAAIGEPAVTGDARFVTAQGRREHDDALATVLAAAFALRPADEWESIMAGADVACVSVAAGPSHAVLMDDDGLGRALNLVTDVMHPVLDRHSRLEPLVRFSRSTTRAGGAPSIGQQTDAVLEELGLPAEKIADFRSRGVIG